MVDRLALGPESMLSRSTAQWGWQAQQEGFFSACNGPITLVVLTSRAREGGARPEALPWASLQALKTPPQAGGVLLAGQERSACAVWMRGSGRQLAVLPGQGLGEFRLGEPQGLLPAGASLVCAPACHWQRARLAQGVLSLAAERRRHPPTRRRRGAPTRRPVPGRGARCGAPAARRLWLLRGEICAGEAQATGCRERGTPRARSTPVPSRPPACASLPWLPRCLAQTRHCIIPHTPLQAPAPPTAATRCRRARGGRGRTLRWRFPSWASTCCLTGPSSGCGSSRCTMPRACRWALAGRWLGAAAGVWACARCGKPGAGAG